ncbi:MAG: TOBE domain-containing protein, partial [Mycobacterium sp.]
VHRLMGGLNEIPGRIAAGVHHSELGAQVLPADVCARDGPATLVIRQEVVRLVEPSASSITGTIESLQSAGIRQRAHIQVGSSSVFAELPPQISFAVGTRVGLDLPTGALHAISTDSNASRVFQE